MARTFSAHVGFMLLVGSVLMLALLGAGCTRDVPPVIDDRGGALPKKEEASVFSGLDGSLTEFAFDAVAESFSAYLLEEPVTENPNQSIFEEWLAWIAWQSDLPVNDTFENPIKLRTIQYRTYMLWTEGEDGIEDTDDDYFKTYRY